MKAIFKTIMACVAALCFGLNSTASTSAATTTADSTVLYLWVVDVSGQNNIYMDEMQSAIDSFFVKATANDDLRVIRYASTVIDDSTLLDDVFYGYSDQRAMLCALDSIIGESDSKFIRAYVLSDFVNNTPYEGAVSLTSESLLTIRQHLLSYSSSGKDIRTTMLILPPSTSPNGYSLEAIRTIMPENMYHQYAVTSADSLAAFFSRDIEVTDRQLGRIVDEKDDSTSTGLIISIIVLVLMLGGIVWMVYRSK